MAKPIPSGSPQNIFLSSAAVSFNGVDVGLVSGVKITVEHLTTAVMSDQFGKSEVNHFHVGDKIQVEMMFDEYTAQKMKLAYPKAALTNTGSAYKIAWGRPIGEDFYSGAQLLEIRATSDDTTYSGRKWTFPKAAPIGNSSFEMGPNKKIEIKTIFHVYPDATQPVNQFFGFFGDAAAGSFVHAVAAAAVAGVNTGNGTVGSESANDQFTKTEVWTLSCIKAVSGAGLFSVTGSVTGERGNATVGSAYHTNSVTPGNSELSFTIAAGGTDFVVGDSFTIATTAAAYT